MNTQHKQLLPRLLLIDDEPGICLAISILFQDEFEVITATSAEEGLVLLQSMQPFTLILLDLKMPGIDKYELLDKAYHIAQGIPIIILTALGDNRTQQDVLAHGAVGLIEKPFCRQELYAKIQEILS